MAKPTFASLRPAESSSTSARHHGASPFVSPHQLNRSSRSRPARSHILALLAAISATPLSIHAHPLEHSQTSLPFLYPSFLLQPTPLAKRADTPSTSYAPAPTRPPPAPSFRCQYDGENLPDRYVLAEDGLWHKTPQWSLYGSSNCPVPCSPPSTVTDKTINNDIGDPGGGPAPPPSLDDFDFSTLPTGWTSFGIVGSSHRGTVIVLALSMVLALIIIAMMFACVFWRRKHVPKRDPEKRRRKYSGTTDDDDSPRSIREAKIAQRKWARAAIRWRDNLRLSARRRRTDRAFAPAPSCSTLTQEEDIDAQSSLSHSRPSSPAVTERSVTPTPSNIRSSSTASVHSSHSRIQTTRVLTSTDPDPPPLSPPPVQPPAYDPPPSSPEPYVSSENTYSDCNIAGTSKAALSSQTQSQLHGADDGQLTSLSGHVATDDKAILSLRVAMASAPPDSDSNFLQSSSVPSMEYEDTYEWPSGSRPPSLGADDYCYEPHPPYSPPTSMLPPPPSKGKQRFDYSYDLDISPNVDSVSVEPQLGPSAPPFGHCEAVPSAPPFDFDVPVPLVPPMDSEDFPDTMQHSITPR